MAVLALDTSNYTTSVAVFDGQTGCNRSKLLEVRPGELGLRQSDALFQHVRELPGLFGQLERQGLLDGIAAVGASTRPREAEGSYLSLIHILWIRDFGAAVFKTWNPTSLGSSRRTGYLLS